MSSSLADDLLRSRSLGDLRELVYTLQVEADGKKSELQSMVGSQYQEFIQSADRIALMQKQSQEVLEMLSLLEKFTEAAIGNVGVLMEKPPPPPPAAATTTPPPPPPTTTPPTLSTDVSCAEVWKALQNMRVMDATVATLHAHLLLLLPPPPAAPTSSSSSPSSMTHYLLPTTQAILSRQKLTEKEKQKLQEVSFLLPAVGQDAKLLILAPRTTTSTTTSTTTTTLPQRAEAFAAYALLGERSLSEVVALFRETARWEVAQTFSSSSSSSATPESSMVDLVRKLQQIILEAYVFFCKPFPLAWLTTSSPSSSSSSSYTSLLEQEVTAGSGPVVHGLVQFIILRTLLKVNRRVLPSASSATTAPPREWVDRLLHHPSSSSTSSSSAMTESLKVFLDDLFTTLSEPCASLLRGLGQAVAVARLQQVALLTSLSLPDGSTVYQPLYREGCAHLLGGGESLWQRALAKVFLRGVEQLLCTACEEVLLQSTHLLLHQLRDLGLVVRLKAPGMDSSSREEEEEEGVVIESIHFPPPPPPATSSSSSTTTTLSSSLLFLKAEQISQSFDRAVGSLLDEVIKPVHMSGAGVGSTTEEVPAALSLASLTQALRSYCAKLSGQFLLLLRTLAQQLQAALPPPSSATTTSATSSGKAGRYLPSSSSSSYLLGGSSSDKAGRLGSVEEVSSEVEKEVVSLCQRLLPPTRPSPPPPPPAAAAAASSYHIDCEAVLGQGLLLVGRLAWLLRYRSPALRAALHCPTSSVVATTSATPALSLDQMQSAFEIADGNGDGILTYREAQEALLALGLAEDHLLPSSSSTSSSSSSSSSSSTSSSAVSVLTVVTTVTFPEFQLIFGSESTSLAVLLALEEGLEEVVALCHALYALLLLRHSHRPHPHTRSLLSSLGLEKDASSPLRRYPRYRTGWQMMRLGLEEEQEEETLRMPSSCSSSLHSLLFRLAQETTHSMVSIDSLQFYPQPRCCLLQQQQEEEEEEEQEERSPLQRLTRLFFSTSSTSTSTSTSQQSTVMLLEVFHRFLYRLVLASLSLSYQQVVHTVTAATTRRQQQQEQQEEQEQEEGVVHDDEIFQLLVDLQVCQRLSDQVGGPRKSFQALEEEMRQCLDPVLAEVTAQPLQQIANDTIRRSHLLLFPSPLSGGSSHYAGTTSEKRGTTLDTTLDLYPAASSSSSSSVQRFGLLPLALMTTSSSATSHAAASLASSSSSSISTKTAPPPTTSSLSTRSVGNSGGGSAGGGTSSGGGIMGWFSSKG